MPRSATNSSSDGSVGVPPWSTRITRRTRPGFLAIALPDDRLDEPWFSLAADALCEMFEDGAQLDLECGALYHAAHGLVVYRERKWGKRPFGGIEIAGTNFVGPLNDAQPATTPAP